MVGSVIVAYHPRHKTGSKEQKRCSCYTRAFC